MRREKLIVVKPSRDDEYHSQIDNKEVPHGACNVTVYFMSGKQAGRASIRASSGTPARPGRKP